MTDKPNKNSPPPNPAPPPEQPKRMTVAEKKGAVCTSLQNKFSTPVMRERLIHLAKLSGGDESLVVSNLNSFLTILVNDEGTGKGNDKRYLVDATTSSLSLCFMESMQLGIPIDRRGLVHVIVYGSQAELEIDYRGFIYYLSKHYTDADFDIKLVFEGDTFNHWSDSGDDKYEYKKDPTRQKNDYTKVTWAFMFMTYVKNGRERSKIEVMDKRELDLVKSKAKTQAIWDEWLGEMYKKAICRRACKLPLAAVDENAIEAIDNKNFDLERPTSQNRLESLMQNQKEMLDDEKKPEPKKDGETPPGSTAPDPGGEPPVTGAKPPVEDSGAGSTPPAEDKGLESSADSEQAAALDGTTAQPVSDEDLGLHDGVTIDQPAEATSSDDSSKNRFVHREASADEAEPFYSLVGAAAWDGKTLIISGKEQTKDFDSAGAALNYLREVISKRRHKESRKAIIAENPLLMGALIREGKGSAIADLHKLADGGI